jgi:hypothetical protein
MSLRVVDAVTTATDARMAVTATALRQALADDRERAEERAREDREQRLEQIACVERRAAEQCAREERRAAEERATARSAAEEPGSCSCSCKYPVPTVYDNRCCGNHGAGVVCAYHLRTLQPVRE